MKKWYWGWLFLFMAFFMTGCYRPYHEAIRAELEPSEFGFLIPTINDDGVVITGPSTSDSPENIEDYYRNSIVNAKVIEIPYYWKETAYKWFGLFDDSSTGKWEPAGRLLVVDAAVTTMKLYEEDGRFHAESSDSVGFGTNFEVSARIDSPENAIKFLSNYPPRSFRPVVNKQQTEFKIEVAEIEDILKVEVATKIQEIFAFECAAYPMDELREQKQMIFGKISETVIAYFEEKGLSITALSNQGGFHYDNPETQLAIDAVFQAQQDEAVAIAEGKAAKERMEALRMEGEGQAQRDIEVAKGRAAAITAEAEAEAEAIQMVAKARAFELEQLNANPQAYVMLKQLEVESERVEQWGGRYPWFVVGDHPLNGQLFEMATPLPVSTE